MKIQNIQAIQPLLKNLDADICEQIENAPREQKLEKLSSATGIDSREILSLIAHSQQIEILEKITVHENATTLIPERLIHKYAAIPIPGEDEASHIYLVTLWPLDPTSVQWLYSITRKKIHCKLALPDKITDTINNHFGVGSASLEDSTASEDEENTTEDEEDENAAIIRFVNELVSKAVKDRATDIHIEPRKDSLNIRYRIDGRLVPVSVPARLISFQSAIISRIKIMSRLNISEKRLPQDGRITFSGNREKIDIRISTLPTLYGESISMRLLSEQNQPVSITDLGLPPEDEEQIESNLERPYGIVLITGPTGSGKSTTLAAFIRKIATPERRVITVEDPVEYEIPEVNQTQVQHEIGLDFASALRSVLRQDPDVIMVGEIRDRETAEIAIRASLTGHLVFSTLHTNDAAGAVTRLVDMDIEPFLVASSIELVIAQRLIRRLCKQCHAPLDIGLEKLKSFLISLGIPPDESKFHSSLRTHKGCESCRNLGFRGRIGIFEILGMTDAIHELTVNRASAREIKLAALENNMRTMQSCGWHHAKTGMSTLNEVMRYANIEI